MDNFLQLVCNVNGIKIIKFIAVTTFAHNDYIDFEKIVFSNISSLINNQYGNYLIQCIIEKWPKEYAVKVSVVYMQRLNYLILQKFSSNVLEKLIIILGQVIFFILLILLSPINYHYH
jgi:hypothetical protein